MPNIIETNLNAIREIAQESFDVISQLNHAAEIAANEKLDKEAIGIKALSERLTNKGIDGLNRETLMEIINSKDFNERDKLLLMLSWGIYFTVIKKRSTVVLVLRFIFSDSFETEMARRIARIKSTNRDNPEEVSNLFNQFRMGDLRIPGLGYSYFTKVLYFYSGGELMIMDTWMLYAYQWLLHQFNPGERPFLTSLVSKNFTLKLLPDAGLIYSRFNQLMREVASLYDLDTTQLEVFLFGWDRRKTMDREYINPRILFMNTWNNIIN